MPFAEVWGRLTSRLTWRLRPRKQSFARRVEKWIIYACDLSENDVEALTEVHRLTLGEGRTTSPKLVFALDAGQVKGYTSPLLAYQ